MPETKKLQVFLCHASLDKPKVRELYRYLRRRGINPWLDAEDLLPGQDWEVEIPKALYASDVIIVCLSGNSVTKEGYVQKEITFALDKAQEKLAGSIFIIPAKLEACDVPPRLTRYHWVDLTEAEGYKRLMRSLNLRAEQLQRAHVEVSKAGETGPNLQGQDEAAKRDEQKVEDERQAREKAEAQRIAQEQVEQERIAREKAEAERVAAEEAEKERLAKLQAESERIEREKVEQKRLAREYEQAQRIAALKAEDERKAREKHERAQRIRAQTWAKLRTPALLLGALLLLGSIGRLASWFSAPYLTPVFTLPTATPEFFVAKTLQPTDTLPPATFTLALPTDIPFTPTPSPTLAAGDVIVSEKDGMKLHYVPAGPFMMGSDDGDADEQPIHQVTLNAFWIDETEVTNYMYSLCVISNKCQPPSNNSSSEREIYYSDAQYADYPVIYVSWNDARDYCSWVSRRLPSEAEWEKAATWKPSYNMWGNDRGEASIYPWGNNPPNKDLLNYNNNVGDTTRVGLYRRGESSYYTYDMAGNVWEWVDDWYSSTYYTVSLSFNPPGPVSGLYRVLRGGSWFGKDISIHSTNRTFGKPASEDYNIGFRCALSAGRVDP